MSNSESLNPKDNAKKEALSAMVREVIGQNVNVIEFREGEALELLPEIAPNFSGVITSPSDYMRSRPDEFSIEKSLCKFDKNKMEIILTDDTRNNYAVTIAGKLELSKTLKSISINRGHKYKPDELARMLRLKRTWFEDFASHAAIISQLKNVKAKVNAEMEKASDNGGNKTEFFKQTVESNMPDSFIFKASIFEGEEEQKFTVDFVLSADSGEIVCELESMELEEAIENGIRDIFIREQEKIQERATIIHIS